MGTNLLIRRICNYGLLAFWIFCLTVWCTMDLLLDLYTYRDSAAVAWYTGVLILPLSFYTLYLGRETFMTKWYYIIGSFLIIYGIYFFIAYFSVLNTDLLLSGATRNSSRQVLPIKNVERVFARKTGFIHTKVQTTYGGQWIELESTRSSYFYLKNKASLTGSVGHSYLGNLYIVNLDVSPEEQHSARWLYIQDWFARYSWLMAGFLIYLLFDFVKSKYISK